jgi:hypothetical protein
MSQFFATDVKFVHKGGKLITTLNANYFHFTEKIPGGRTANSDTEYSFQDLSLPIDRQHLDDK